MLSGRSKKEYAQEAQAVAEAPDGATATKRRRGAPRAAGVVWSPDGKRLLVVLNEETNRPGIYGPVIYVVDPNGRT